MSFSFWRRFQPRSSWQKFARGFVLLGLAALAFVVGRYGIVSRATAVPPQPVPVATAVGQQATPPDYSRRAVAYIYGNVMISREELGEFLIARYGAEKLDMLVNQRIIDLACKQRGITVAAAEVEEVVQQELKNLGLSMKDFEEKVLKPRHMSLYEWREDGIRPRLALTKLCRDRALATEKDVADAYEAYHGEKIQCRMIIFPKGETKTAMNMYLKLRDSDEEFVRMARQQASPSLAATGGKVPAFGRHSTGSDEIERAAFSLHPGEVSQIVGTPEGDVIIKCDARIPPDGTKLHDVRARLEQEIIEKKISQELIPKLVSELRTEAKPNSFLTKVQTQEQWLEQIRQQDAEAARLMGALAAPSIQR